MGIPSYFSYLVRNHLNIIKKYDYNLLHVGHFYLDCNSIVYDVVATLENNATTNADFEQTIISSVITKIEEYINIIKPSKHTLITFDGVAPFAKLQQQRSRRYKAWYQNELFGKKNSNSWSTANITPGTPFMTQLTQQITAHFSIYTNCSVSVSGSNCYGEGEHKLFAHLRQLCTNTNTNTNNDCILIYGLDSDLIMLSINHLPICPNIYLFRETPHFINSIDNSLEPNAHYYLDIPELKHALALHLGNDKPTIVYDYIFLCFFLGNDFLPHFPALNIRTGGIDKLLQAYKHVNVPLTNGKTIHWTNVKKLVSFLAEHEATFIVDEHRGRNAMEKRKLESDDPVKHFENTPIYNREHEAYINPLKPCWQYRYYRSLFHIHSDIKGENKRDIALNYLQGLEWTFKYYVSGCPDWQWYYKYDYPPLLQDLVKFIPSFDTEFFQQTLDNPVNELVQLCYVLPRNSLHLAPKQLYTELLLKHSDWYKTDCQFVWAYCRYFWEAHVVLPDINLDELQSIVKRYRDKFAN